MLSIMPYAKSSFSRFKRIIISESIHFKRNGCFLTEPHQIEELLQSILENVTHRTTPIKNKYQTMILTISKSSYFLEKIFIVLVSVKFGAIKNTSAGSSSTSIRICCLTTFKLFNQIVNFFLSRFELETLSTEPKYPLQPDVHSSHSPNRE